MSLVCHCNWGCTFNSGLAWPFAVPSINCSPWLLQSCNFHATKWECLIHCQVWLAACSLGPLWTTAFVCWPWGNISRRFHLSDTGLLLLITTDFQPQLVGNQILNLKYYMDAPDGPWVGSHTSFWNFTFPLLSALSSMSPQKLIKFWVFSGFSNPKLSNPLQPSPNNVVRSITAVAHDPVLVCFMLLWWSTGQNKLWVSFTLQVIIYGWGNSG